MGVLRVCASARAVVAATLQGRDASIAHALAALDKTAAIVRGRLF